MQYIKDFTLNTYYGIRQWLLQIILFDILCRVAVCLRCGFKFGKFGIEGIIITGCLFLYTMLFYCFRTFTQHMRPLHQIIIPYIPYALMIYLKIVSINDWEFKRVTLDSYMLEGLLMPIYSLAIIRLEYTVKRLLPNNIVKRVIKIVWNVLTILLLTLIAIGAIGLHFSLKE